MLRPSRDHVGSYSKWSSPSRVSLRGSPSGKDWMYRWPVLSYTTAEPSGETSALRTIVVSNVSGATSLRGRGAS